MWFELRVDLPVCDLKLILLLLEMGRATLLSPPDYLSVILLVNNPKIWKRQFFFKTLLWRVESIFSGEADEVVENARQALHAQLASKRKLDTPTSEAEEDVLNADDKDAEMESEMEGERNELEYQLVILVLYLSNFYSQSH